MSISVMAHIWAEHEIECYRDSTDERPVITFNGSSPDGDITLFINSENKLSELIEKLQKMKGGESDGN